MSEHMSPIPSRIYNAAVGGHVCGPEDVDFGQKVVHLVKYDKAGNEVSFESQVTQANKIYVIHDDFVLSSNVTIPANCVLEFDGGSISGAYTITTNNCYIEGDAHFDCAFSGEIKNGAFNVTWMMDSDFGSKVNHAGLYFLHLYMPAISVKYNTPIYLTGSQKIQFEGVLEYCGVLTNNSAAFTIEDQSGGDYYINTLTIKDGTDNDTIDFEPTRTINFIGLSLRNLYGCTIRVTEITGFNEAIRFWAYGYGSAANNLFFTLIRNYNFGIRFYQEQGEGTRTGWCHENTIFGGYMRSFNKTIPQKYAVFFGGPAADGASYKDNSAIDERDAVDCCSLYNIDFESHAYPVYARNTYSLSIINCREEGVTGLLEVHGALGDFYHKPKYADKFLDSNFNNCNRFSYSKEEGGFVHSDIAVGQFDLQRGYASGDIINYDVALRNRNSDYVIYKDTLTVQGRFTCAVGAIIPNPHVLEVSLSLSARFDIVFLDSNYNDITKQTLEDNDIYSNNELGYFGIAYYDTQKALGKSASYICMTIPSNVVYVFVGVIPSQTPVDETTIMRIKNVYPSDLIVNKVAKVGASTDRPSYIPFGKTYFESDNSRMLICNGGSWFTTDGVAI